MSWNYRVCRQVIDFPSGKENKRLRETVYSIREVYNRPFGYTENAIELDGFESKEDVIQTLELMLKDAKRRRILKIDKKVIK